MTSSGSFQLTSNRKKVLYTFDQCFRQFLDKALQKSENISKLPMTISKLPITENRIEKLLLIVFYCDFLFSQIVEKSLVLLVPYCIMSAYAQNYEIKFTR